MEQLKAENLKKHTKLKKAFSHRGNAKLQQEALYFSQMPQEPEAWPTQGPGARRLQQLKATVGLAGPTARTRRG